MPIPRAFLAIERTIASAMRNVWDARAATLAATLQPLLDDGKWGDAQTVVNKLSLNGVVGDVRDRIEELAVSAVLFGAHHAAGSIKATTFMRGKAMPAEIKGAIDQLVHSVEVDGRDQVCNQLHLAIEAMKQADPRSHMQKSNPNHDALGRFASVPGGSLGKTTPEDFIAARNKSTRMQFMSPLVPSDLSAHSLYVNSGKTVGVAVDSKGDVQNVFNNGGPKGAAGHALVKAIAEGGRMLDCYEGFLPGYYRQFGFEETGRMKFNPAFAHNWDVATQGTPDVVFMAWKGYPKGGPAGAIARASGPKEGRIENEKSGRYYDDYDEAKADSRTVAAPVVARKSDSGLGTPLFGGGAERARHGERDDAAGDSFGVGTGAPYRPYIGTVVNDAICTQKAARDPVEGLKQTFFGDPIKRPDAQLAEIYPPDEDETGVEAKRREKYFGLLPGVQTPVANSSGGLAKDDISDAQLEETGGLLSPEQAQADPKKKRKFVQKADKTLYVHRDLVNSQDFLAWAKTQGFATTVPVEELHVTLCYSKGKLDWDALTPDPADLTVMEGDRRILQFGDAVVLTFDSDALNARNAQLMSLGATSDFPVYHSHMTITYDPPVRALDTMEPYAGPLIFGPEVFEPLKAGGFDPDALVEQVIKWERLFKDDRPRLADMINEAVRTGGTVPIDTAASLTTSRLVSLGFLAEGVERGIKTYQVNEILDDRTCPVCEYMNGKTFDVQSQFDRIVQQLQTADPAGLKSLAPWPGQSKDDLADLYATPLDELQAQGLGGPPYHPNCYIEGTHVYTRRGFIDFRDVNLEMDEFWSLDPITRETSWQKAATKQVYDYDGEMRRIGTGWGTSAMVVTPEHTMLFDRRVDRATKGRVFDLRFGSISEMMASPENWLLKTVVNRAADPEYIEFGHSRRKVVPFVRLLAYFLAEGNVHARDRTWSIIAQEKHKRRMEADARGAGFAVSSWGDDKLAIKSAKLGRDWSVFGKAHQKFVPDWVKRLSASTIFEFLDAYALGDGSRKISHGFGFGSSELTIYTSSIRMRDDLVELALLAGKAASFRLMAAAGTVTQHQNGAYASNYDCWLVSILNSTRRKPKVSIEQFAGKVYDVTLARNHTLLIAHNGTVTWGSNCRGMLMLVGSTEETIPLGGPIALPEEAAVEAALETPAVEWPTEQVAALRDAIEGLGDQAAQDEAEHAFANGEYSEAQAFADDAAEAEHVAAINVPTWSPAQIDALRWKRFDVTDPIAFAAVDAAFEAGKYSEAQQLVDDWLEANPVPVEVPVGKADATDTGPADPSPEDPDDADSSPNAPRLKRKLQSRAGREQDYDDIADDSSSIAFDNSGANDNGAPIDKN